MTYDEKFLRTHNAHHLWQPMAHPRQVEGAPPTIIVRGEGVHVWDLDGNRLVDGMEARFRAVSVKGRKPQGYISGEQARAACGRSGKRLCEIDEWVRAIAGFGPGPMY